MAGQYLTIEQVLSRLAEHPAQIAALTDGLTPAQLRQPPGPEEWSASEVLAHLRACADVWGGYIRRILAEDRPQFRAVSPRTYIRKTDYPELEFAPSFEAFTAQRADLLATLQALPPESWSRAANVQMAGRILDQTVLDYTTRLVIHERGHVRQIEGIVKAIRM